MWISIRFTPLRLSTLPPPCRESPLLEQLVGRRHRGLVLGARKGSCHGAPVARCTESATRSVPIRRDRSCPSLSSSLMYSMPLSRSAEINEIERLMRKKPLPPLEGDRAVDLLD